MHSHHLTLILLLVSRSKVKDKPWSECELFNSHASQPQPTANNSEPSSNLSNKIFKDILQKETAVNFLTGNEFKAILQHLKKV